MSMALCTAYGRRSLLPLYSNRQETRTPRIPAQAGRWGRRRPPEARTRSRVGTGLLKLAQACPSFGAQCGPLGPLCDGAPHDGPRPLAKTAPTSSAWAVVVVEPTPEALQMERRTAGPPVLCLCRLPCSRGGVTCPVGKTPRACGNGSSWCRISSSPELASGRPRSLWPGRYRNSCQTPPLRCLAPALDKSPTRTHVPLRLGAYKQSRVADPCPPPRRAGETLHSPSLPPPRPFKEVAQPSC